MNILSQITACKTLRSRDYVLVISASAAPRAWCKRGTDIFLVNFWLKKRLYHYTNKHTLPHLNPGVQMKSTGRRDRTTSTSLEEDWQELSFLTCACFCISPLRSSKYVLSPSSYSASNISFNFLFLSKCFFLAFSSVLESVSSLTSSSTSSTLNFQKR